jgi:hypothetical protein
MKASELITLLQKTIDEHGDVLVFVREDGFGGYALNDFGGVSESPDDLYPDDDTHEQSLKDLWGIGENLDNLDDEERDQLFQELKPLKYIEISSGTTIYST